VLFTSNSCWNLLNFRAPVIRALIGQGVPVVAVAPPDGHEQALRELGCDYFPVRIEARGLNPLRDAALFLRYLRLFSSIAPAAVLAFTVKPNIYASLAAQALGIPVLNTVSGLGSIFLEHSLKRRIVEKLYRLAFRRSTLVFFQNDDDRELFEAAGLVPPARARRIAGSGINLRDFAFVERNSKAVGMRFLMIARLLVDKGVAEYAEAARRVREVHPEASFELLGEPGADPAAGGISASTVNAWVEQGILIYQGSTRDVRPYIRRADCIVLPSYREGVPRVLLEAAAIGRPIVATDVVGCRDVVDHGFNGLLCRPRDAEDLAQTMLAMIGLPAERRAEMGRNGRDKVERLFDERFVVGAYLQSLEKIVEMTGKVEPVSHEAEFGTDNDETGIRA
jgi:glycosyltransferase involved in cell wall biosynthesis